MPKFVSKYDLQENLNIVCTCPLFDRVFVSVYQFVMGNGGKHTSVSQLTKEVVLIFFARFNKCNKFQAPAKLFFFFFMKIIPKLTNKQCNSKTMQVVGKVPPGDRDNL